MTTYKWHATTPLTPEGAQHFWDVRYGHGVTPWDRGGLSPALGHWLNEGVLEPSRILVPGCGRGYEVVELARRGFDVTAVDLSPTAIEMVSEKLEAAGLSATLVQADFFRWKPDSPFDSIYEQTSLCALLPDQWRAYVKRLSEWLVPGGRLFALFMQTNRAGGPPFHCDLDAMKALFAADAWAWSPSEPEKVDHSTGFFEFGVILKRI